MNTKTKDAGIERLIILSIRQDGAQENFVAL